MKVLEERGLSSSSSKAVSVLLTLAVLTVCFLQRLKEMLLPLGPSSPSTTSSTRKSTSRTTIQTRAASLETFLKEEKKKKQSYFPSLIYPLLLQVLVSNGGDVSLLENYNKEHWLCDRHQILSGSWEAVQQPKPPYVTPVVHLRCYPSDHYKQRPWHSYGWVPEQQQLRQKLRLMSINVDKEEAISEDDGCEFTEWNATLFCRILEGASVLIVGDSLSWEHYASLAFLLGLYPLQGLQFQSKELAMTIGQAVCGGKTRILYRRDDRLQNVTGALWQERMEDGSYSSDSAYFPSVLVLNRGAHYANDTVLEANLYKNLVETAKWLDECKRRGVRCHFFWRTSVPGHPECHNATQPENSLTKVEKWIEEYPYDERMKRYHWSKYQHQNLLVEDRLQSYGIDYGILDAYYLNVRRPDEHRAHQHDCLHSCYPGKMDVYNQLLLHFLRRERTTANVDAIVEANHWYGWHTNVTTIYDPEATELAKQARKNRGSGHDV